MGRTNLLIKNLKVSQKVIHTRNGNKGIVSKINDTDSFVILWDNKRQETWRNTNFLALDETTTTPAEDNTIKKTIKKKKIDSKDSHDDNHSDTVVHNDDESITTKSSISRKNNKDNHDDNHNDIVVHNDDESTTTKSSISRKRKANDNDNNDNHNDNNTIKIKKKNINSKKREPSKKRKSSWFDSDDDDDDHFHNGPVGSDGSDDLIPPDLMPSLEEFGVNDTSDNDSNQNNGIHGDNDDSSDRNDNRKINSSDQCCVGDNCDGSKLNITVLEFCSNCKTPVHHICSVEGRCPKDFGCGAKETDTGYKDGTTVVDDIIVKDMCVVAITDKLEDFFEKSSTARKIYIKTSVLHGFVRQYVDRMKLASVDVDEDNLFMKSTSSPSGIDKNDEFVCEGSYCTCDASDGSKEISICVRYGNTSKGWLVDLSIDSFRNLVNRGKARYSPPVPVSTPVPVSNPTPAATFDTKTTVEGLKVTLGTLDRCYVETMDQFKKTVLTVPENSLLLSEISRRLQMDVPLPFLVKVFERDQEVLVASYDPVLNSDKSCLIMMASTDFIALSKANNFEHIRGFGNSVTTFPPLIADVDSHLSASGDLMSAIEAQKRNDPIRVTTPSGNMLCIQKIKFSTMFSQDTRSSAKSQYVILKSDGTQDNEVTVGGRLLNHDILYRYYVSHIVATKEATIVIEVDKSVSKREVQKLVACNLYCRTASRGESDFTLLKVVTQMDRNAPPTFYLVYSVEEEVVEMLRLNTSQVTCDFFRAVPADTLASAKLKMIDFLTERNLLFDISRGINISNPNYADSDCDSASTSLQETEFNMFVPLNYVAEHQVARHQLSGRDGTNGTHESVDDENVGDAPRRRSSRVKCTTNSSLTAATSSATKPSGKRTPAYVKTSATKPSARKAFDPKTPSKTLSKKPAQVDSPVFRNEYQNNDHVGNDDLVNDDIYMYNNGTANIDTKEVASAVSRDLAPLFKQFREHGSSKEHTSSTQLTQLLLDQHQKTLDVQQQVFQQSLELQQKLVAQSLEVQQKSNDSNSKFAMEALEKVAEIANNVVLTKRLEEENRELRARSEVSQKEASARVDSSQTFALELIKNLTLNHKTV